jgi:putative ABC transport system permease protein
MHRTFEQDVARVADHYINERFGPHGLSIAHSLQPLSRIFLHSDFTHGNNVAMNMVSGDIRNVYIFSFLALVVIIIAVFNFVNLITVQSEKRAREIGMRKVMGAQRKDMVFQFIGESLLLAAMAFVFSLILNELLIHPFSQLLDENFRLAYWQQPGLLLAVLGFVVLVGVLAGLYPALYLSRFQPIKGVKRSSRFPGTHLQAAKSAGGCPVCYFNFSGGICIAAQPAGELYEAQGSWV